MDERARENIGNPDMSNVKLLHWISSGFKGVTRQHLEGAGVASVIVLTGVFAAYMWKKRREESKANESLRAGTSRRGQILGALRSGGLAIKRILDTRHASDAGQEKSNKILKKLTKLLENEDLLNFIKLQNAVAKLEMTRKEDEGLRILSEAYEGAENKGRPQEAYELDMLIVEMLIYKGDYQMALKRKCLRDEDISDARRPLYKTIVQLILEQEEAIHSWHKYQDLRGRWREQDSLPDDGSYHPVVQDFGTFKKTVKFLEKEIADAHRRKTEDAQKKK